MIGNNWDDLLKEEYEKVYKKGETTFSGMLTAVGMGIKKGFNNAKTKYKEIFEKFLFASRFMVFQRIRRITVKKARKFVLRKTNLRALRDFGIILYPDSGGINLVSTSDFR